MPRNIEIKARVADMAALREKVSALADEGPTELDQDDAFFACRTGRLKLRTLENEPASAGVKTARGLMRKLGVGKAQLVESVYADLLAAASPRRRRP